MIPQLDGHLMRFGKETQTETQIESDRDRSYSLIEDSEDSVSLIEIESDRDKSDSLIFAKKTTSDSLIFTKIFAKNLSPWWEIQGNVLVYKLRNLLLAKKEGCRIDELAKIILDNHCYRKQWVLNCRSSNGTKIFILSKTRNKTMRNLLPLAMQSRSDIVISLSNAK